MYKKRLIVFHQFDMSLENNVEGWNMPYAHLHEHYEIYILESGSRTVTVNGQLYETHAYDAVLFSPNCLHRSQGSTPYSGICIHFSEEYLKRHFTESSLRCLLQCFAQPCIHLEKEAFLQIREYADRFLPNKPDNFVILAAILRCMNQEAAKTARPAEEAAIPGPVAEHTQGSAAGRILQYIAEHYIFIRNIKMLSDTFQVSESYIFSVVRKYRKQTPKQYINQLRVQHACRLLEESDMRITEISENCGFDSSGYFIRVFKQAMNCTPGAYRQKRRYSPQSSESGANE